MQPRPSPSRRAKLQVVGDPDLGEALKQLGFDCGAADALPDLPPASDIWIVPTKASGAALVDSGTAKIILHGRVPTATEWLSLDRVPGQPVVAVLPSTPVDDPAAWKGTLRKAASGDLFGLRHYVEADAMLKPVVLHRGSDRGRVRELLRPLIESSGLATRASAALLDAADELVIRALVAAGANSLDETELPIGREIRVSLAVDEHCVGVSVSDLFTRKSATDIARILATALAPQPAEDIEDLALVNAARSSIHVAVDMIEGCASEIICLVPRTSGRRARTLAAVPRSFAVFARCPNG